mmetsp:Transcript_8392/g.10367  ORF Transcript_8392/g.10367 Transcript_8392/m.10367 type:complete len:121 (+) Transcript_8392:1-363(+)
MKPGHVRIASAADGDGLIFACKVSCIPKKAAKRVKINKQRLAIFNYKGSIYAMDDQCSHQRIPLSHGDIEEINGSPCVVCPGHFFKFDLQTGKCEKHPKYSQRTYPTQIIDDDVYVQVPA